jgi:hypothetical protein
MPVHGRQRRRTKNLRPPCTTAKVQVQSEIHNEAIPKEKKKDIPLPL